VLAAEEDYDDDDRQAYRQEARRWKAAALALGLLALGAALLASVASATRASAASLLLSRQRHAASSSSSSAAHHQALVAELGLNATQALLLDASRIRAFLRSDAWRERQQRRRAASAPSSAPSSSRGVVVPAGGRDHLLNALVLVRHLRAVGCTLPIEVVHFGPDEIGAAGPPEEGKPPPPPRQDAEASSARKAAAALSREPGVRLVDARALPPEQEDGDEDAIDEGSDNDGPGSLSGTAATTSAHLEEQSEHLPHHRPSAPHSFGKKVWAAAYAASFRHVLLLDGDSLPLLDPAPLFDAPDYKRAGSMFWPDFWHDAWTDASLWRSLGVVPPWQRDEAEEEEDRDEGGAQGAGAAGPGAGAPPPPPRQHGRRWRHRLLESGQLLIDRARHADVLEWAWLLNGPNREVVYKAMHGDKDTWRLAFDLAGKGSPPPRGSGGGAAAAADANADDDESVVGGFFFMVPHKARDVMREGPPGHRHRWHHIGVLQAAPRGVPLVLRAAKEAAAAAAGGEGEAAAAAATTTTTLAALRQAAAHAFDRAIADNSSDASSGWPFFLHRTSFNAKFFPDCARRPDADKEEEDEEEEEERKAALGGGNNSNTTTTTTATTARRRQYPYCRPTHSSVPLADEQAGRALKPHMYAFDAADVAAGAAFRRCGARLAAAAGLGGGAEAAAAADSPSVAPLLLGARLPERACASEGLAKRGELPLPTFELDLAFPYVSRAVDASMRLYRDARRGLWEA
jgi:hypothetical protein